MTSFTPEAYQSAGADWLLSHDRAALFTGMGLGKTATCLMALERLFSEGACKGVLIIAPKRVAMLTWPDEIAKWGPFSWMKTLVLRSKEDFMEMRRGRHQIYVTNYEQIPNLCRLYFRVVKPPYVVDTVIFDELTKAKNPTSSRIRSLSKFLPAMKRRWGLTGTPNPNSLLELFAQVRVLDDGQRLGTSYTRYKEAYFDSDYMGYQYTPRPGAKEQIYNKLRDLVLVQRSEDYAKIPPTITEDVEILLPKHVREQYATLEKKLLLVLDQGAEVVALSAATLVTKLQQLTSGVVYESTPVGEEVKEKVVHRIHDAKITALKGIIRKSGPVLVATNFRHERAMILEAIPRAVEWDDKILPKWNAKKVPVLVADPRSIGHGLNLQAGGCTVVWFSLTYSRELYDQFNARLARKGQGEETFVYRIIARDTIDEAITLVLKSKDSQQRALLDALNTYKRMTA